MMNDDHMLACRSKRSELLADWLKAKSALDKAKDNLSILIQRTRFRPDGCLGDEPVQLDKGDAHSIAVLACLVYEGETRLRFAQRLLDAHREHYPSLSSI